MVFSLSVETTEGKDVNSQGVDKDDKRAFKWYTLAADQGHADAQYGLGVMHSNGQSVEQSLTKAREWLTKSASQ